MRKKLALKLRSIDIDLADNVKKRSMGLTISIAKSVMEDKTKEDTMDLESQGLTYDDDEGLYVWKKGVYQPLSKDFNTREFTCPCTHNNCVKQIASAKLVAKLQSIRNAVNMPIGVNSGYRCSDYQKDLAARGYETAVGISQHQLGFAADIRAADLLVLVSQAEKEFMAIGIGHTFIHVDLRDDKIRRWRYSSM